MNARPAGRTASCSRSDAIARLRHAEKFLEVADLTAQEAEADKAYANVSASLAVLAGIAAGDAACCARLGRRPRGQDHRQATALLAQVSDADDAVRRSAGCSTSRTAPSTASSTSALRY